IANFIFMTVLGMEYAGMISVIVALTNLIPTFGPIVGGVLGAFILLMVRPFHALLFLAFTVGLQFLDGYVIKPRLFGNTLGVSGLFILIGVVVGGNMFGILGILLAIPVVAIIDLIYSSYLMPWLEGRRQKETATPASDAGSETAEVEDGTQS
ncbi:MAG: AI-2E family transporter, partial [Firmicutes bacterium]|nr:AI-2E family transporter [Bacillota bacterium]